MDRSPRLVEFVVHLTGCDPADAGAAVEAAVVATSSHPLRDEDPLAIVARALCTLRHRLDLTDPVDLRDSNEVHTQ